MVNFLVNIIDTVIVFSLTLLLQVHYKSTNQPVQVVNVTTFTGNYTLDNLRPYTEYSVYVTAVRLIGTTGRSLEGEKSRTVTARTLAGGLLDFT